VEGTNITEKQSAYICRAGSSETQVPIY